MARVTTLIYKATGRTRSTSGSITPEPTDRTIRPALLNSDETIYSPALLQDGLILAPFVDTAQSFYGPIVSADEVFVSPPLLASTQVFFPPTVNQTIYLPLTTNTQTFHDPQVLLGQSIVAPLLSSGNTFYGPTLNLRVDGPLLTETQSFYAPTIITGTSILPTLLTNDQTFYGAQLNLKVSPALLTNTQTFYGPTIGQQIVAPTTFANGQAFYPPQINLRVVSGRVNNTQTFYGPVTSSNALIVAPLLSGSPTIYAPQLNLKVAPALLTNAATLYAPAVIPDTAQAVSVPYLENSQTFYGARIDRNIKPVLFTNTVLIRPPSVNLGVLPGYALSTPTVTLTSSAGQPPAVDIGLNADHWAGYYLDIHRSSDGVRNVTDGTYSNPTLQIAHQITPSELAALTITNDDLALDGYADPTGAWFQQYRIRREDGALSAWATQISGTVTVSVAKLTRIDGADKHQALTVNSDGFSFTGPTGGATALSKATVNAANSKFHMEIEVVSISSGRVYFGIGESGLVVGQTSLIGGLPGNTSNNGFTVFLETGATRIFRNGGEATLGLGGALAGDVYSIEYDTSTRVVSVKRNRGGTITTASPHTLTSLLPNSFRAFAGANHQSIQGEVSFQASAIAATSGYGFYA